MKHLSSPERKKKYYQLKILYLTLVFQEWRGNTFSNEEKLSICHWQNYSIIMVKVSDLSKMEIINKQASTHHEEQ